MNTKTKLSLFLEPRIAKQLKRMVIEAEVRGVSEVVTLMVNLITDDKLIEMLKYTRR